MKKNIIFLGALLLSVNAFAHDHFIYTDNLDVSGKNEFKMKAMLAHPAEGKEQGAVNLGTVDGKTTLPGKFFVVHNGEKTDLTSKVKLGKIKTDKNEAITFDAIYSKEDGLKGGGSWVFVMTDTKTSDEGYTFSPSIKLIVTKDSAGSDYNKRVAEGHNEIVPLVSPVNAWKENVFRAKFVDENGKAIAGARVDIDYINATIDLDKDTYKGGKELAKSSARVFTDDNGVFAFSPSRSGKWVVRAVASLDKENKFVKDASLVVQFD